MRGNFQDDLNTKSDKTKRAPNRTFYLSSLRGVLEIPRNPLQPSFH